MDHKPGLLSRKWVRVLLYAVSALLLACGVFLLVREHVLLPDPDFVMPETPAPTPEPTPEPTPVPGETPVPTGKRAGRRLYAVLGSVQIRPGRHDADSPDKK